MQEKLFTLKNNNGVEIDFITKGAKLTSVKLPSKDGLVDICIGYDTIKEAYEGDDYMGAICGRVANRIGNSQFILNGETIKLNANEGVNQLHGGANGFQVKEWDVQVFGLENYVTAYKISLISPDGDENYPGNLSVEMVYALNDENELLIDIQAKTDKATVINLTSHPYFNLNGVNGGKIFNHELELNAKAFTPINNQSIPTGEIKDLENTDLDFSKAKRLGDVISSEFAPIKALQGIDHNFVINKADQEMGLACKVNEPISGRAIEVYTTQPGVQIYTGMHFDGIDIGKGGIPFQPYCGVAIEAQNFPDGPNHANFPNCVLNPNEVYKEKIIYKFQF